MMDDRKTYQKKYKQTYAKTHKQLSLTLLNAEYKTFEALAKKEGVKVSTLVKNMAIAYQQQQTFVPASIEQELKELKFLIRNIANNVNQMAHYSNTIHALVDENEFLGELQKLEQTINDYTLGKLNK